jgi:hypothetical protein
VDLSQTRTALHGVAELLLAGPQYDVSATIRLRALPGGIATVAPPDVRLEGAELVAPGGRCPLAGTYAEMAAAVGLTPRRLDDVYSGGPGVSADDPVVADAGRLAVLVDALALGDAALRVFAPGLEPVLWPEHLDVALTRDEVNFGVSPGDGYLPEPYAYVGPWEPRTGPFWNQPFGAARPMAELADLESLVTFFAEGAALGL